MEKDYDGKDKSDIGDSNMAKPTLVRFCTEDGKTDHSFQGEKKQYLEPGPEKPINLNKCPPYSLPLLKCRFDKAGLSKPCRILALHAWREGTRKTYRCYIIQWMMYCDFHNFDPYEPSVRNVTNFLRLLFQDGASYSTINIARCALSAVIDTNSRETIGSDPMVSLVLRGCGNLRPPEPKYDMGCDEGVQTVPMLGIKFQIIVIKSGKETHSIIASMYSTKGSNDMEVPFVRTKIHGLWCSFQYETSVET